MKIEKNNLHKILLILIIILAVGTRILFLSEFPASFNMDEASKGYQAYSILKTGIDLRGNNFPMPQLTDFSDKLPSPAILYQYIVIPSIAIFGLNEFAARLPAAIFGILTVIAAYFLAKELFHKKNIALLSAFFLAISPLHIFLSRLAIEPILLPFFFLTAFFLLYRGIKKNKLLIPLSAIFFGLSLYAYQTALLFIPLFLLGFFVLYRNYFKKYKKEFLFFLIILFIITFPILYAHLANYNAMMGYFNETSLFSITKSMPFLQKINFFFAIFFQYLNPIFLFKHFLFPVLLLSIIGLVFLWKYKKNARNKLLIYSFIISVIPSALTVNSSPTRSVTVLIFTPILAAYAFFKIISVLSQKEMPEKIYLKFQKIKKCFILLFIASTLFNALFLLKDNYPYNLAFDWHNILQCGFKEPIRYIEENQDQYEKIVFTNKANQPFIYFLFYLKYDPEKFHSAEVKREYINNWEIVTAFDKYKFCDINKCYNPDKNNLYIARGDEIPDVKAKKVFHNLDGSIFRIITND